MKRFYQIALIAVVTAMMATAAYAVPARPNMWRKIRLNDGTECFAFLRGDENFSFLVDREGNAYRNLGDGTYERTGVAQFIEEENGPQSLRAKVRAFAKAQGAGNKVQGEGSKAPRKASGIPTDKSKFRGQKHGLVILAQFSDVSFNSSFPAQFGCSTTQELYDRIINTRNLDMEPFYGSVKDYFIDQSDGVFELDFDVVGPVTLPNTREYYGAGMYQRSLGSYKSVANDSHSGFMAYQAIQKAKDATKADGTSVDFSDYDWDGDGEAEVVYVIYAGEGQADGGDESCIWPHKFTLSSAASNENYYGQYTLYYKTSSGSYARWSKVEMGTLSYNNTTIDTYACSNEMVANTTYVSSTDSYTLNGYQICGIGTICHEFSHTMGYPDMYDTDYAYDNCAQGSWDLMNSGSYNGSWNGGNEGWSQMDSGYRPCAYTSFERWCAGWMEPIELTDPKQITDLKPLGGMEGDPSDHGEAYVVYMPGSARNIKGEYYLLENRQLANWDAGLPWFGLLINYVHYNESNWQSNNLNTTSEAGHARMTHFQAGGFDYGPVFWEMDAYPYSVAWLPELMSSSSSFYDEDGAVIAANINDYYKNKSATLSDGTVLYYKNLFYVNTGDNDALTDTQAPRTSGTTTAYYYGTGSTKKTLSNQEIWGISSNNGNINHGWYDIHGGSQTVNFNYRRPETKEMNLSQGSTQAQSIDAGFYTKITTDRNVLGNGRVNTLWLPFSLNYDACRTYFGADVQIYSFAGYAKSEGFLFDETTLEGIKAYTPVVVVLPEGTEDIDQLGGAEGFAYVQVDAANEEAEPVVESPSGWKFVGTKEYAALPVGSFYISNNMFYKAQGTAMQKAYRAYFQAPELEEVKIENLTMAMKPRKGDDPKAVRAQQANQQTKERMNIRFDAGNPLSPLFNPNKANATGVYSVEYAEAQLRALNDNVYNLNGQCVGTRGQMGNLHKGIYVVNGKRIVIK